MNMVEKVAVPQSSEIQQWISEAYRDPEAVKQLEDVRFTRWNMEVAYAAGFREAVSQQTSVSCQSSPAPRGQSEGMVARVARALAGHFGPEYDQIPVDRANLRHQIAEGFVWDCNTPKQDDLKQAARAAIEAMRPDDTMSIDNYIVSEYIDAAISEG